MPPGSRRLTLAAAQASTFELRWLPAHTHTRMKQHRQSASEAMALMLAICAAMLASCSSPVARPLPVHQWKS